MRVLVLCAVVFAMSCTSQTVRSNGNTIVAKDNIGAVKAETIVREFLAQETRHNIEGKIVVGRIDADDRARCNASTFAREHHGEFCDAHYYISHSNDPLCIGSAQVIEDCGNGECKFRFSEFVEICE